MDVKMVGSACFGIVIGWITYRTLRRSSSSAISDIASVIAAVGGGVLTMYKDANQFAWYSIGLAIGFFSYFIVGAIMGPSETTAWMKGQ